MKNLFSWLRSFCDAAPSFGLCFLFFTLSGCGGGSGDSSTDGGFSNVSAPPTYGGSNLKGSLYFWDGRNSSGGSYVALDLKSSKSSVLIGTSGYFFSVSPDGSRIIRVDGRRELLQVFDSDNLQLLRSVDLGSGFGVFDIPKFSPDNKYLSMIVDGDGYLLVFLNSNGGMENSLHNPEHGFGSRPTSISWSVKGQLFFAVHNKVFRLKDVLSKEVDVVKEFDANYYVNNIEISPDGSRMAFVLGGSSEADGNVYIMNIDGANVRELAHGSIDGFSNLSWSPDGRYLAMIFGSNAKGVSAGGVGSSCGSIWIVSTESYEIAYIGSQTQNGDISNAYKIEQVSNDGHFICPSKGIDWR